MAKRYPAASFELLGRQAEDRMTAHDIVCLHTMVGTLAGTDSMFKDDGFAGTESHFGTGGAGEKVKQWQDLAFSADANLDGWRRVISIENADKGPGFKAWSGSNVPAFTEAQLEQIVDLVAWLCSKEAHADCPADWKCHQVGIPAQLIPDTLPGRRGIGYHRQGVDGSLPDMRVEGGEKWSLARGKVCPGDRRVEQIREQLVPLVAQRLAPKPEVSLVDQDWTRVGAVNMHAPGANDAERMERALERFRHLGFTVVLLTEFNDAMAAVVEKHPRWGLHRAKPNSGTSGSAVLYWKPVFRFLQGDNLRVDITKRRLTMAGCVLQHRRTGKVIPVLAFHNPPPAGKAKTDQGDRDTCIAAELRWVRRMTRRHGRAVAGGDPNQNDALTPPLRQAVSHNVDEIYVNGDLATKKAKTHPGFRDDNITDHPGVSTLVAA